MFAAGIVGRLVELAVHLIDDWQGKGLGTLLVEVLSDRPRQGGITSAR